MVSPLKGLTRAQIMANAARRRAALEAARQAKIAAQQKKPAAKKKPKMVKMTKDQKKKVRLARTKERKRT